MSSSPGSSGSIREQLPIVHTIARGNTASESVMESWEQKVDELLKYKEETYSLRSQLQIVRETSSLQAAEFAFQKDELEKEVTSLRAMNQQLSAQLEQQARQASKEYSYEVKVRLETEKAKTIQQMEKTAKWKGRAKSARDQIDLLKAKVADAEGTANDVRQTLEAERGARARAEAENNKEVRSLKSVIAGLNEEKEGKEKQVQDLREKLSECGKGRQMESARNRELELQNEALRGELETAKEQEAENQRMMQEKKRELENSRRENDRLVAANKRLETESKSLNERLENADTAADANEREIGQAKIMIADLEDENMKLKSENRRISGQLQEQVALNERNKGKIDGLEKQIGVLKLDSKEAIDELQAEKARFEEENERLDDELEQKNKELGSVKNENKRLQQKVKAVEEAVERLDSEVKDREEEKEELERQIASLRKDLQRYENQSEELEQAKEELLKVKEGKGLVLKALEVVPTSETDDEWKMMGDKARKLIETSRLAKKLEASNEKLRGRLQVAADEIKRKPKRTTKKDPEEDVLLASLQTALHDAQSELTRANDSVRHLRLQLDLSHRVDKFQRKALLEVTDLYQSVCGRDVGQLRALILAVVFSKRLANGAPGDLDVLSLRFFGGRPSVSIFKQIADIRRKFSELNQDLVMEKHNKADANGCEQASKESRMRCESEQTSTLERKIESLKATNRKLKQKISAMISSEEHELLEQKLARSQKRNKKLEAKLSDVLVCLEEGNKRYEELRHEYKALLVKSNAKLETASGYKAKYEEAKAEVVTLTSLMKESRQELFSLERLVQKQHSREACIVRGLNNMAVENRCLKSKVRGEPLEPITERNVHPRVGKGLYSMADQVNPAFL